MYKITERMWDRGLTLKKWAAINEVSLPYTQEIIAGRAGRMGVGTAKKILSALVAQGFMTEKELIERKERQHGDAK